MDMRLAKLAKSLGCSIVVMQMTSLFQQIKEFPTELAISYHEGVVLGTTLVNEIKRAGFDINGLQNKSFV